MRDIIKWIKSHRLQRTLRWLILDGIIVYIAYTLAFSTRALSTPLDYENSLGFIAFATLVTLMGLYLNGVYRRIWSQTSGHGVVYIVQGTALAYFVLLIINVFIEPRVLPLSVLMLSNILAFGGFVIARYRSRLIRAFNWRWRALLGGEFPEADTERALIIGAGESGQMTALRLEHRIRDTGIKVIGFLDDDPDKIHMYVENKPVLGATKDVESIAESYNITLIILAIHNISGSEMRQIISVCQKTSARIQIVPDMRSLTSADISHHKWLRDVQPEDLIGRQMINRHQSMKVDNISKRVVLVTGAAGSIGSELCHQMLDFEPEKLILLDCNESGLHDLYIDLRARHPDTTLVSALVDVTNDSALQQIFDKHQPQIVYHAAAYKHVPMLEAYPNKAIRVNIGGTLNVARQAVLHDVERFVLISTDKAVEPTNVMGASKRICELITHAVAQNKHHDTLFTAVRFGNVLGSRGSVVPTFERQIESGGPVTVTHPDMTRYFMSIPEAVNLVIHAASITTGNEIFILHMGDEVRILDIAERMIRLRGLRPYHDIPIEFVGIRPGEKLHEKLHTYYEKPLTTEHPKVMKLCDFHINGQAISFIEAVERLIHDGVTDDDNALERLLSVCEIGEQRYSMVD